MHRNLFNQQLAPALELDKVQQNSRRVRLSSIVATQGFQANVSFDSIPGLCHSFSYKHVTNFTFPKNNSSMFLMYVTSNNISQEITLRAFSARCMLFYVSSTFFFYYQELHDESRTNILRRHSQERKCDIPIQNSTTKLKFLFYFSSRFSNHDFCFLSHL